MDGEAEERRLEELSDADLISLVARGDDEAFDHVYLRYKDKLARFIKGFVSDDPVADDLLQESFLRVYQNAGGYTPTSQFSSWLFRIAANLCLNELRRRRTHPTISLNRQVHVSVTDSENETIELHELIPDTSLAGPEEAAEASETLREVMSAIASLSSTHRDVVEMRVCEELKYEQIAGILNCPVGTVKSRAFHGLRALRDKLQSAPEEPETKKPNSSDNTG